MKYALVEDEIAQIDIITKYLKPHISVNYLDCFEDSLLFLDYFRTKPYEYDLIFLDIDMPNLDGISLAKKIYSINSNLIIVFITGKKSLVYDAFGMNVFKFIIKEELEKGLNDLFFSLEEEIIFKKNIVCNAGKKIITFNRDKIIYCEKINKNIEVITIDGLVILNNYVLSILFDEINHPFFVFINRSTFINLKYIKSIKKGQIDLLHVAHPLEVSRGKQNNLITKFNQLMRY